MTYITIKNCVLFPMSAQLKHYLLPALESSVAVFGKFIFFLSISLKGNSKSTTTAEKTKQNKRHGLYCKMVPHKHFLFSSPMNLRTVFHMAGGLCGRFIMSCFVLSYRISNNFYLWNFLKKLKIIGISKQFRDRSKKCIRELHIFEKKNHL